MMLSHPLTMRRIGMILDLLATGPRDAHEVAAGVFMSKRWATEYLLILHSNGWIHIGKWVHREGDKHAYPVEVWRAGPGKDARKPKAMTSGQKAKKCRVKMKADQERYDKHLARQRMHKRIARGFVQTPLVMALFGARP